MNAGLPYTALRDAMLTHPTLVEGLIPLFLSAPSARKAGETEERKCPQLEVNCNRLRRRWVLLLQT